VAEKFALLGDFGSKVFLDSVVIAMCCIYICVFKYFIDISGFLYNIDKCSQLLFGFSYL
jgi:hypothetical protein